MEGMHDGDEKIATTYATVLFEYLEYLKLKGPWDRRLTLIEFVNSFSINEPFGR